MTTPRIEEKKQFLDLIWTINTIGERPATRPQVKRELDWLLAQAHQAGIDEGYKTGFFDGVAKTEELNQFKRDKGYAI